MENDRDFAAKAQQVIDTIETATDLQLVEASWVYGRFPLTAAQKERFDNCPLLIQPLRVARTISQQPSIANLQPYSVATRVLAYNLGAVETCYREIGSGYREKTRSIGTLRYILLDLKINNKWLFDYYQFSNEFRNIVRTINNNDHPLTLL